MIDCSTIFSLPLKAAPKSCPAPSLMPRKVVTSSSRARMTTTIQGATPVIVFTLSGQRRVVSRG